MNNYDDIFAPPPRLVRLRRNSRSTSARGRRKSRPSVYDLADNTAQKVVADGEQFRAFLNVQARFGRYSATNALLIYAQMPTATQLRDFDGWKSSGAFIKKQQKGISILEPGKEYEREDGTIGISYDVKKVFDISQTTALRAGSCQTNRRPNAPAGADPQFLRADADRGHAAGRRGRTA